MRVRWCSLVFLVLAAAVSGAASPPDDAGALCRQALALHKDGRNNKALELYLKAAALAPEDWRCLFAIGRLYRDDLKQPLQALKYFDQAARVEKTGYTALFAIFDIYYGEKQWENAVQTVRQIVSGPLPVPWRARRQLVELLIDRVRPQRAAEALTVLAGMERAATTVPERAEVLLWRGRAHYRLLQLDAAQAAIGQGNALLEAHLKRNRNDHEARWLRAFSLCRDRGLLKQSVKELRTLLKRAPHHPQAAGWRALYDEIRPRTIEVTLHYEIAGGDFNPDRFIQLPVENAYQKHLAVAFEPAPDGVRYFSRYGNRWALLTYRDRARVAKTKLLVVKIRLKLIPRSLHQGDTFPLVDKLDTPEQHLDWENQHDPEYRAAALRITAGETDLVRRARLLQEWLHGSFTYELVGFSTLNEHFVKQIGECGTWSNLAVSLFRSVGIPSRWLAMHVPRADRAPRLFTHISSEYYHPHWGWVPVDHTENRYGYISHRILFWRSIPRAADMPRYHPRWMPNFFRWLS